MIASERTVMDIRKAVVPVAGHGTRLLPATKSQPKEMLPVGRKPVVQYVVEELEKSGVKQILFVTGSKKRSIEDHFDKDMELLEQLHKLGRTNLINEMQYQELDVSFYYVRQSVQRGLADAVNLSRDWVGEDNFVCALGDSIIWNTSSDNFLLDRMKKAHLENKAAATIAIEKVAAEEAFRYGIIEVRKELGDGVFEISKVVEKTKHQGCTQRHGNCRPLRVQPGYIQGNRHDPARQGRRTSVDRFDHAADQAAVARCRGTR